MTENLRDLIPTLIYKPGEYLYELESETPDCPLCGGEHHQRRRWNVVPGRHQVADVEISKRQTLSINDTEQFEESISISYHLDNGESLKDPGKESNFFRTAEEAQAECDKRNAAIDAQRKANEEPLPRVVLADRAEVAAARQASEKEVQDDPLQYE